MTDPPINPDGLPVNEYARSPFKGCPVCGSAEVAALNDDWNDGRLIPIVGCGNPWHYIVPTAKHLGEHEAARQSPASPDAVTLAVHARSSEHHYSLDDCRKALADSERQEVERRVREVLADEPLSGSIGAAARWYSEGWNRCRRDVEAALATNAGEPADG